MMYVEQDEKTLDLYISFYEKEKHKENLPDDDLYPEYDYTLFDMQEEIDFLKHLVCLQTPGLMMKL